MHNINIEDKVYFIPSTKHKLILYFSNRAVDHGIIKSEYRGGKELVLVSIIDTSGVVIDEKFVISCSDIITEPNDIETVMHNILVNLNKLEKKIIKQK